jgi:uncharacterized protein YecA (UPF0149 family)
MAKMTNEKAFAALIGALSELKEDTEKKREAKLWKPIDLSISLNEGLNRLPKYDLDSIRKNLQLRNCSSLKKAELIDVLSIMIPEYLKNTCKLLDSERYSLIKKVADRGGYIDSAEFALEKLQYFNEAGMIFTGSNGGKKVLVMPKENIEVISAFEDREILPIIKRNTEWIKMTLGMLKYYGVLKFNDLVDLLKSYFSESINLKEYLDVMYEAESYYKEFEIRHDFWSHYSVENPREIYYEQKSRGNLTYYRFSKEQLLAEEELGFFEKNKAFERFAQFLYENYDMSNKEAVEITKECANYTRMGAQPKEIIDFLGLCIEISDVETLSTILQFLMDLMNNTRQWEIKGHTPAELFEEEKKHLLPLPDKLKMNESHPEKKVGRNEPCPCGSNKKYKKCCGR